MIVPNKDNLIEDLPDEQLCYKDAKGRVHHDQKTVVTNHIFHECIKCTISWEDEEIDDDDYEENFSEDDSDLDVSDLKGLEQSGQRDLSQT